MTKEAYNKILESRFEKVLKPMGFRRNGVHYYLYEPPVILQIQNGWQRSDEMLFALTLDYLSNTKDDNGKISVSKFPWDFPLSISPQILRQQYRAHKTVRRFKFDYNFFTREMATTRNFTPLDLGLFFQGFKKTHWLTETYIDESIGILLNEGMQLKSEFDSDVAYLAMNRFRDETYLLNSVLNIKQEIKNQIILNGRSLPKWKFNFFEKMMLNHHYKQMDNCKPV